MARVDDKAVDLVSEDGQLGGRNPQPTRRNLTGTGGSNVTYPAQEARDENQPQPQRNIDGAQGGTVDCAETTELTCDSTDSAQGGTVDCAATTELTCSGTDSAQRGTAVTRAERNTDGAQGGAVDCAVTTEPTATATPVAGSKRKRPKGKRKSGAKRLVERRKLRKKGGAKESG
jgi:hypothetical protein